MVRVGLVGEDPYDNAAIKNLLKKKYKNKVEFIPLVKNIKGHQLDAAKISKMLPIEFHDKNCKFVVYMRDLDGFKSEKAKLKKRQDWFKNLDSKINKKGILLLNIWELECLLLADIDVFNKIYGISHSFRGDPMMQKDPKETLKRLTAKGKKKYHESDCPEVFEKLDINTVQKNCSYFKEFLAQLDSSIKAA